MDALASKARLIGTDFTGANLYRADLSRVVGDARTTFAEAEVGHVRFLPTANAPQLADAGTRPPPPGAAIAKEVDTPVTIPVDTGPPAPATGSGLRHGPHGARLLGRPGSPWGVTTFTSTFP